MINIDYKYTNVYSKIEDFTPVKGSTYIYGYSTENRSHTVDFLKSKPEIELNYIELEQIDKDVIIEKNNNTKYNLRNSKNIKDLIIENISSIIYIDISGLNNRISASLLNNAMKLLEIDIYDFEVRVIYMEPEAYNIKLFKAEGVFNDLSEKIDGIEPLPGFANVIPDELDFTLVALLGFEGGRFTHIVENLQPPIDKIIPVIGVPGYRIEYPFVAFWGNRRPLKSTKSYENIKYAAANSLVDVYMLLKRIKQKSPNTKIKLAPIGTKPHAIGAMLFAIKHSKDVELVYDNPKRASVRTEGVGLIVESLVSKLIKEN